MAMQHRPRALWILRALVLFRHDEAGSMTIFGMFLFVATCAIGAAALDVTHFYAAQTQLQVASDLAAHAALYKRRLLSAPAAKAAAITAVEVGMPEVDFGQVLTSADITFGTWDAEARRFAAAPSSISAVRVQTGRLEATDNPVGSFLFRIVGVDQMDVGATSIFATFRPFCLQEGFVAEGVVDIQSNNGFTQGFCVHSNTYVSMNSNNYFEPGTVVSMPNTADLDLPQSGFKTNEGLASALRSGVYNMLLLNRFDELLAGLTTWGSIYMPEFITSSNVITLPNERPRMADFVSGRIHRYTCARNQRLTLDGGTYNRVLLVTNCEVKFNSGVILQDVVIATTNTSANSLNSSSGLQVGRNDNCAEGGGAQLVTKGGVNIASGLQMFGGQIIALRNVEFAANANGIMGASIVAGGEISGTSNMDMGYCGHGMENNFEADYYRLAG